jgi:transposase
MGMPGPQMVDRYGVEFKLTAVKMSESPGVLIKDVAESLCIHPNMLSKWRKQVREGVLVGKAPQVDPDSMAELKRLHDVEKKYQRLQLEHDLLKKAIRFASDLKAKSSPSSRQTGKPTRSK